LRGRKDITREESWCVTRLVYAHFRWYGWLDLNESSAQRIERALELDAEFQNNPGMFTETELRRAVPPWVFDYADAPGPWLASLQSPPRLWLRTKRDQAPLVAKLLSSASPGPLPDSLLYTGKEDLFRIPEFQAGQFQLQDICSQAVSWVCNPQPKQLWWDTCAGEGGKMLHLTSLMGVKGSVWATDRADWRLHRLKLRARRCQVFNYRIAMWDGGPLLPSDLKFDGVLVDAPCSGIGTWQRNPHARWTLTPEDVKELAAKQLEMLNHSTAALKPGARLVYSVCTTTHAETREVVEAFNKEHPEYLPLPFPNPFDPAGQPVTAIQFWPHLQHGNAMYVAAWQKPGPPPEEAKIQVAVPAIPAPAPVPVSAAPAEAAAAPVAEAAAEVAKPKKAKKTAARKTAAKPAPPEA
jgi:16S rRNA (cytosine967-C5)-methyltransferase